MQSHDKRTEQKGLCHMVETLGRIRFLFCFCTFYFCIFPVPVMYWNCTRWGWLVFGLVFTSFIRVFSLFVSIATQRNISQQCPSHASACCNCCTHCEARVGWKGLPPPQITREPQFGLSGKCKKAPRMRHKSGRQLPIRSWQQFMARNCGWLAGQPHPCVNIAWLP